MFRRATASGSSSVSRVRFSSTGASRTWRRHLGIDLRHGRDAVEQGAQIQARAADEDRQSILRLGPPAISRRAASAQSAAEQGIAPSRNPVEPVLGPGALLRCSGPR